MKTYQVEIVEKIVFQVSVEAANETEAENMARDQYDKGVLEMCIRDRGIGLTRTEHMFFDDQKIVAMREMILADSVEGQMCIRDRHSGFG